MANLYTYNRNVPRTYRNNRIYFNDNTATSTASGGGGGWLEQYFNFTDDVEWNISGVTGTTTVNKLELNNDFVISGASYTGSFTYYDEPYTGITGSSLVVLGDLWVDGNIYASNDIVAYIANEVSNGLGDIVFDNLDTEYPLYKNVTGSTVGLLYDNTQFYINASNELSITGSIGNSESASYADNALSASYSSYALTASYAENASAIEGLTPTYVPYYSGSSLVDSAIRQSGTTVTVNADLYVSGTIGASGDIIAYLTNELSGSLGDVVFDNLDTEYPIYKNATNKTIGLKYNNTQFFVNGSNELEITGSILYSESASYADNALSASYAISSSYANIANSATSAISSSYHWIDDYVSTSASGATLVVDADLYVSGNISASEDIVAYVASEISGTIGEVIFDNLNVESPIYKNTGTESIGLKYNTSQFFINGSNELELTGSIGNSESASYADNALSASYALVATTASYSNIANSSTSAISASYATTASYASNALTSSFALVSTSASYASTTTSASYANNSTSSSFALNATSASHSEHTDQVYVGTSTTSASRPFIFGTSTTAGTKSLYTDTATTCYINPSTNVIGATTFIGSLSGNATGNLTGTASYATTASYSHNNTSSSYALNATSSSYALNGTSSSYASTATSASYAINSTSASFASTANTAHTSSYHWIDDYVSYNAGETQLEVDIDLFVSGNITASEDIVAYVASSISGSLAGVVFDNLNVEAPIYKNTGTESIGLKYNTSQFYLNGSNELTITGSYVTNTTDTYTSTAKALYMVTLTQTEYDAIGTKDNNTLYIII